MRAWSEMFNGFLENEGTDLDGDRAPYTDADYFAHVDGKPRYDGVRDFLSSRGIELPEGTADDPPTSQTVRGLGNRKNEAFNAVLARDGVRAYPGSVAAARPPARARHCRWRSCPPRSTRPRCSRPRPSPTGSTSSSTAGSPHEQGLAGKPAPDTFVHAARALGVPPERAVVLEDAVSGVRAGAAGGFGRVIGVDRGAGATALRGRGCRRGRLRPRGAGGGRRRDEQARERHQPAGPRPLPGRPVAPGRDHAPGRTTSARPRPCSRSATATSACAGTPRRAATPRVHGTFINGFHETWPIRHAEAAVGFARIGQTIVNVPDAKMMKLYVDDEPLILGTADLESLRAIPRLPRRRPATQPGLAYAGRASGSWSSRPGWSR